MKKSCAQKKWRWQTCPALGTGPLYWPPHLSRKTTPTASAGVLSPGRGMGQWHPYHLQQCQPAGKKKACRLLTCENLWLRSKLFTWPGASSSIIVSQASSCYSSPTRWRCQSPPQRVRLTGLVVKASTSEAEDPEFDSRLRWDFYRVKSYQWIKNWHSSGYPARRLAL